MRTAPAAPAFAIVNARAGGIASFGKPWLSPVFGVQNAFDRKVHQLRRGETPERTL
jgi:hypothetical protein